MTSYILYILTNTDSIQYLIWSYQKPIKSTKLSNYYSCRYNYYAQREHTGRLRNICQILIKTQV